MTYRARQRCLMLSRLSRKNILEIVTTQGHFFSSGIFLSHIPEMWFRTDTRRRTVGTIREPGLPMFIMVSSMAIGPMSRPRVLPPMILGRSVYIEMGNYIMIDLRK